MLTSRRIEQIITRVSERTNGVIEQCLIDELFKHAEEDFILAFCDNNGIIIKTEEQRIDRNYDISHSQEMALWLQARRKDENAINELLMLYQPKCNALMCSIFNRDKWIELDDAFQIAWIACWQIIISDKFQLHNAQSLNNLLMFKVEKIVINVYRDLYVDGINHHTPKDQIVEKVIQYVAYIDECDYESNPYDTAKDDNDIVTTKQAHNGRYESSTEDKAILWAVVNNLPEEDRDIFLMSALDGITQVEIAKIMGCTQQNIAKRMQRITAHLREEVVF